MCSRILQCVTVYCSVLQCVADEYMFDYMCMHIAVYCSVLQCIAVCCSVLQRVAVCCSVSQCAAACFSVLQINTCSITSVCIYV